MTLSSNKLTYALGPYKIHYLSNMIVEIYHCEWYDGIIFHVDDKKYDVVNNYALGPRMIITEPLTGCRDIPFHSGSWWLLPAEISVVKEDENAR